MIAYWVGPITEASDPENLAFSPAANDWSKSFVAALDGLGHETRVITYEPLRIWPHGKLFSGFRVETSSNWKRVPYLNLPFLREIIIGMAVWFAFLLWSKPANEPVRIFFYNNELRHRVAARLLRLTPNRRATTMCVVADYSDDGCFDFFAYLSYCFFLKSSKVRKIHFDGGIIKKVNKFSQREFSLPPLLTYIGGISEHTGIIDFIKNIYPHLTESGISLEVWGSGPQEQELIELSGSLRGLSFRGFLDGAHAAEVAQRTLAFLNPRPISGLDAERNFPSKIQFYLNWDVPIISTRCPGLAPYYGDVLFYYSGSADLIRAVEAIDSEYENWRDRLYNFRLDQSWEIKMQQFIAATSAWDTADK